MNMERTQRQRTPPILVCHSLLWSVWAVSDTCLTQLRCFGVFVLPRKRYMACAGYEYGTMFSVCMLVHPVRTSQLFTEILIVYFGASRLCPIRARHAWLRCFGVFVLPGKRYMACLGCEHGTLFSVYMLAHPVCTSRLFRKAVS